MYATAHFELAKYVTSPNRRLIELRELAQWFIWRAAFGAVVESFDPNPSFEEFPMSDTKRYARTAHDVCI